VTFEIQWSDILFLMSDIPKIPTGCLPQGEEEFNNCVMQHDCKQYVENCDFD
jgi:hypothetical protein